MQSNYFALIMAGGQGTRFWPWSTAEKPKQFLAVIGKRPLITQTYQRLQRFIPAKNIFVIADKKYLLAVRECLPGFSRQNFIAEPAPRNTAPALIQANIFLSRIDPGASLLVVPADHHIADEKTFAKQLSAALAYARNRCIITAGIKPSEPHTGYGYIQFIEGKGGGRDSLGFFPIKQFKEKPDQATAVKYLRKGNFYWNSGMFIYKIAFFRISMTCLTCCNFPMGAIKMPFSVSITATLSRPMTASGFFSLENNSEFRVSMAMVRPRRTFFSASFSFIS